MPRLVATTSRDLARGDGPANDRAMTGVLSEADLARVAAALQASPDRVLPVEGEAGRMWVKRPRRGPGHVHHALAALGAAFAGQPMLKPAAVSLGAAGLAAEARRLARLARSGWKVPAVLDLDATRLVLADNGVPLGHALGAEPERASRRRLLDAPLALLAALHAAGRWHGAAQVRNFTRRADGIGMIDFEDEVETVMSLADRQGRDLVLFLLSAARYLDADAAAITELARATRSAAPAESWARVERLERRVAPLHRALRPFAHRLGRDGVGLVALFDGLAAARR